MSDIVFLYLKINIWEMAIMIIMEIMMVISAAL